MHFVDRCSWRVITRNIAVNTKAVNAGYGARLATLLGSNEITRAKPRSVRANRWPPTLIIASATAATVDTTIANPSPKPVVIKTIVRNSDALQSVPESIVT